MKKNVFSFLEKDYRYLNNYIKLINKSLLTNPQNAFLKERMFIENLTQEVAKRNGFGLLNDMSQSERLRKLESEGSFTNDIQKSFHNVRILEKKSVHSDAVGEIEAALDINKEIYKITSWFVKEYINPKAEIADYKNPVPVKNKVYGIDEAQMLNIMNKQHNDINVIESESKIETKQNRKKREDNSTDFWIESIFN